MANSALSGFVVVDLSTGIAGGYCTKLLSDGGAEVIKVEAPEGDPLRRWSASGVPIGQGEDGALFSFLAGGKRSVVADPAVAGDLALVNDLLASADAVVWSPGSPLADDPTLAPAALQAAHPHLIVAAITPFGLEGPWSERPATEFTLQAWSGGIVGLGRGAPDRAPVYVGGRVGDYLSGSYASAAILASRMRVLGGGGGELIDVSMLESHVMGLTYYPVTYFEMLGRPWRDARKLTVPGIARVKDGLVDVGCGTAQQWFDLCAMTGHEDWIDEDAPLTITEQANEKSAELYAWMAERTGDEVRDLATAFRIPNAPVASPDTVESLEHFTARGSFVTQPGRIPSACPSVSDQRRRVAAAVVGAAARRAHRAVPDRAAKSATSRFCRGSAAAQWHPGCRSHHVLGRSVVHAPDGPAGCRGDPCRVDPPPRRHQDDRRRAGDRGPMVGEAADLRGAEHQQEGHHTRLGDRAGPGTPSSVDRHG